MIRTNCKLFYGNQNFIVKEKEKMKEFMKKHGKTFTINALETMMVLPLIVALLPLSIAYAVFVMTPVSERLEKKFGR